MTYRSTVARHLLEHLVGNRVHSLLVAFRAKQLSGAVHVTAERQRTSTLGGCGAIPLAAVLQTTPPEVGGVRQRASRRWLNEIRKHPRV